MTLIDKAEALLPCPFCGGEAELWNARDNRPAWIGCMGRCAVLISKEHTTDAEAIAAWNRRALPARGVGVKPLVWQPIVKGARRPVGLVLLYRKSVTAEDKLVAAICKGTPEASDEILLGKWRDGAWRQWNTGWTVNGVTHWMPLPEPPEILAALAPTDAAQAREAAARLLLDMLHMRNGAHEGVSKEDAQKMWDAASTREGYAAVDAFLRSIIGEART